MAAPPEHVAEHLHVLTDYALAGEKSQQGARARRLAADLGISDPDEALTLLERRENRFHPIAFARERKLDEDRVRIG